MAEPTPILGFERARRWAVTLLRHVADELEQAEPRRALDALLHLAAALHDLDRTSQLVLPARQPPAA